MPPPSQPRLRQRGESPSGATLPDWVGRQYYRHGLFCASHPTTVLLLAAGCVLWTCWPLFTLPIYGGEVKVFAETVRGRWTTSSNAASVLMLKLPPRALSSLSLYRPSGYWRPR